MRPLVTSFKKWVGYKGTQKDAIKLFVSCFFVIATLFAFAFIPRLSEENRSLMAEKELAEKHLEAALEAYNDVCQRADLDNEEFIEVLNELNTARNQVSGLNQKIASLEADNKILRTSIANLFNKQAGKSAPTAPAATKKAGKAKVFRLNEMPNKIDPFKGTTQAKVESFFDDYAELSKRIAKEYKSTVPAEVLLAQMALESGWGQSELFLKALNAYGLTYGGGQGIAASHSIGYVPSTDLDGQGKRKPTSFCVFASLEDGARAHIELILSKRYSSLQVSSPMTYAEAMKIGEFSTAKKFYNSKGVEIPGEASRRWDKYVVKNWKNPLLKWAYGLGLLGYAEDPGYGGKLVKVINNNNLSKRVR